MTTKSKEAFEKVKEFRPTCRSLIFEAIKNEPLRTDELIKMFKHKYSQSSITTRISELNDDGLIMQSVEFANETRYTLYTLTPPEKIEEVKRKRYEENLVEWAKGYKRFENDIPSEVKRWIEFELLTMVE